MADKVMEKLKMEGYMHSIMPNTLAVASVKYFPVDTPILIAYIAGLFAIRRWRLEKLVENQESLKDAECYLEGFIRSVAQKLGISDKEVDDIKLSVDDINKYGDVAEAFNDVGPLLRATVPEKSQTDSGNLKVSLAFAYVNDGIAIASYGNLNSADLMELVDGLSYFVGLTEREQNLLKKSIA